MKKKYIVRDEDKNEFEVEEIETVKNEDEEVEEIEKKELEDDASSLSADEIAALKKLAAIADKLVSVVEIEKDEHEDKPEGEMLDEDEEIEEDEEDEDTEEIVDTDEDFSEEKMKGHDSKKSVGSIARKSKSKDSIADAQELDVAEAWAKRYGGK